MTRRDAFWATMGLLLPLVAFGPNPVNAAEGPAVVNCHDEALGTVQKTLARDCNGRIVGDTEAEAIREKRRERIRRALAKPSRPQFQGHRLKSVGSGFFVATDGALLTNHHVVDDCAVVTITPTEGEMAAATQVVIAEDADLALLRSSLVPPGVAAFGTAVAEEFATGPASLVGYPNLGLVAIEPVLTTVEVVEKKTSPSNQPVIIIKGEVRSGNSGGPLLDRGGSVIGVVFAKVNSVKVFQMTGKTIRNVGLALSRETVLSFLDDQGVDYRIERLQPSRTESRVLNDAKPYLAQVGCWG